jgi:hypothetical protein
MHILLRVYLSQPTREQLLPRSLTRRRLLRRYPGLDLSKNTLCYRKTSSGLLVGQREDTLDLRVPIIVELELTKPGAVIL